MPPKRSRATPGGSSSLSSSGSGSGEDLLHKAQRRSKRINLAVKTAQRDRPRIDHSITKLCQKVRTLEQRVSELETVCGQTQAQLSQTQAQLSRIQEQMAEMIQREVKQQMHTVLDTVEAQVVAVIASARPQ